MTSSINWCLLITDVTNSHFQQFREFPRQSLIKTCSSFGQMKAVLFSLLLKHSQHQTLHTHTHINREGYYFLIFFLHADLISENDDKK